MEYIEIAETVRRLKAAEAVSDLKAEFTAALRKLGFQQFAYVRFKERELIPEDSLYTYSEAWVLSYFSNNYQKIDPVFKRAFTQSKPFFWSSEQYTQEPELKAFFYEASQFGIHQGITCPMRSASTKRTFLTVAAAATPDGLDTFIDNPKLYVTLNTLAQVFHQKAIEFSTVYDHEVKDRERQVLQLSSWGLTTEDMSAFLELNKDYVNEVVASAIVRLGVNNRVSAVQRARDMGYIE